MDVGVVRLAGIQRRNRSTDLRQRGGGGRFNVVKPGAYRDRTTLIITTDHGRGHGPKEWLKHGAGEALAGCEAIWIAMIGPGVPARGEIVSEDPVRQSDIAATALRILGLDHRQFNPKMGPPIQEAFDE